MEKSEEVKSLMNYLSDLTRGIALKEHLTSMVNGGNGGIVNHRETINSFAGWYVKRGLMTPVFSVVFTMYHKTEEGFLKIISFKTDTKKKIPESI